MPMANMSAAVLLSMPERRSIISRALNWMPTRRLPMSASQGYSAVPEILTDSDDRSVAGKEHRRKMALALNGALRGKVNCVLDVVVTANATSTTITDPRISYFSFLHHGLRCQREG